MADEVPLSLPVAESSPIKVMLAIVPHESSNAHSVVVAQSKGLHLVWAFLGPLPGVALPLTHLTLVREQGKGGHVWRSCLGGAVRSSSCFGQPNLVLNGPPPTRGCLKQRFLLLGWWLAPPTALLRGLLC